MRDRITPRLIEAVGGHSLKPVLASRLRNLLIPLLKHAQLLIDITYVGLFRLFSLLQPLDKHPAPALAADMPKSVIWALLVGIE